MERDSPFLLLLLLLSADDIITGESVKEKRGREGRGALHFLAEKYIKHKHGERRDKIVEVFLGLDHSIKLFFLFTFSSLPARPPSSLFPLKRPLPPIFNTAGVGARSFLKASPLSFLSLPLPFPFPFTMISSTFSFLFLLFLPPPIPAAPHRTWVDVIMDIIKASVVVVVVLALSGGGVGKKEGWRKRRRKSQEGQKKRVQRSSPLLTTSERGAKKSFPLLSTHSDRLLFFARCAS